MWTAMTVIGVVGLICFVIVLDHVLDQGNRERPRGSRRQRDQD